jgi:hypothetical protein
VNACVQMLVITSEKVDFEKRGSCTLVDNEPPPPADVDYASEKGWKEVTGFTAVQGGRDFLFPKDQLMLVSDGKYRPIEKEENRQLGKLNATKNYLVWYHHLFPSEVWKKKKRKK